ncbi:MAG: hypothetical protein ABI863_17710 [Ginsengibacter sp.]
MSFLKSCFAGCPETKIFKEKLFESKSKKRIPLTFNLYKKTVVKVLLIFIPGIGSAYSGVESDSTIIKGHIPTYYLKTFDDVVKERAVFSLQARKQAGRTFIINTAINDLDEFRKLVKQASGLKAYGTVQINIGMLADKSFYEIPKGGNPWNEYASNNAPLYKFFPDAKIAPFIPAEFVKKNRQLLVDKAKILRDNGIDAAFFANEPGFLPSAFFDAYPNMRGPRVDHPRRSNFEFFSPCVSVKETQEMYVYMMGELLKTIPDIRTFFFKTNDAGGGFCWSDWLYSGPNGPTQCKNQSTGERVKILLTALKEGAAKAGKEVTIYLTKDDSNFSDAERNEIDNNLPTGCYFIGDGSPGIASLASFFGTGYPVKGILDPLSFLKNIQSINKESASTIFIGFKSFYNRGNESPDVTGILIDMLKSELQEPNPGGQIPTLQKLMKYCEDWAGKNSAEQLFNAFISLSEALKYRATAMPGVSGMYMDVSNRFINRPLVIAPQRLSENEESYFLPYVFNVSKDEARMDYIDLAGSRKTVPDGVIENYVAKLKTIYGMLEKIDASAPKKEFIQNMAAALRIYASLMRSCGNFVEAQAIRDRNAAKLSGPVHRPDKEVTWAGDPDFIRFNEIMRDELDNAQDLIGLLEKGGMDFICHAKDSIHEDTFLPGPELLDQVKKKRKIMLDHWRDIEGYMASPLK